MLGETSPAFRCHDHPDDAYHLRRQSPHTHRVHGSVITQPIVAIQGSSTGPAGIPYIADIVCCAPQSGQRG